MQLHTLEIEEDVLSACSAQSVLQHFYDAGLVAISGLYTPQQIAQLEMAFQKALEQHIQAHGGLEQLNKRAFGKNHIGFFPPLVPPFSNVEFVAHPHLIPLLESLLGADFICCFYHTNTAYPGSEFQPVHRDHPPCLALHYLSPILQHILCSMFLYVTSQKRTEARRFGRERTLS